MAGRDARVLRVLPPTRSGSLSGSEGWYWVDQRTCTVLRWAEVYGDGTRYEVTGFVSLDLNPSVDPTVFDPHIPEGARITRMKHGALSELANEVGLAAREPADLPAVWKPEPAVLSLCPPEEPVAGSGHWQVQWSYCLGDPTVENRLTFAATDRPPAEAVIGTPAEILPGVVGWYVNGRPSSELSSLSWSAKGIHYTIRDKTSAAGSNPYLPFKLDELVKLAREIMPGS